MELVNRQQQDSLESQWWVCVESAGHKKYAKIEHSYTLGSARTCQIPLHSRSVKPIEGVFHLLENGRYVFRKFSDRQSELIHSSLVFEWSALRVSFMSEQEFLAKNIDIFWGELRQFLKSEGLNRVDQALNLFLKSRILGSSIPKSLEDQLIQHFNELRLEGPVERLLSDREVTDILVESWDAIFIEKKGEVQRSALRFSNEKAYKMYIENLLSKNFKQLDENSPALDLMLNKQVRAHVIAPPITDGRTYLSIRRAKDEIWSLGELLDVGFLDEESLSILRFFIKARKSILISGGTGSGKTSLLNAILKEVPLSERLVLIEDTPELRLTRSNVAFLRTRVSSDSGLKEYSMRALVKNSLRMRPDRIIIGELRSSEAQDFVNAINTGHRGSLSSIHANSAEDAIWRLRCLVQLSNSRLPSEATVELIGRNIDAVVFCGRNKGHRSVEEICEVVVNEDHRIQTVGLYV